MESIFKYLLLVYLPLALIACDGDKATPPLSMFQKEIRLQKKEVVVNASDLKNPQRIVLTDSLILILDYGGEFCINVFDKAGNYLFDYIKRGKGPEELIMPFDLFTISEKRTVGVFDVALNSLFLYNMDSLRLNRQPIPLNKIHFDTKLFKAIPMPGNRFIGVGPFEGGKYALSIGDSLAGTFLSYPDDDLHKNEPDHIKAMAYQGSLMKRPNNNMFVMAAYNSGVFEICKLVENNIIKIHDHYSYLPEYEPMYEGEGYSVRFKAENKFGYSHVAVTENSILLLYSGRSVRDNLDKNSLFLGNKILVFDWEGKPKYCLQFEEEIMSFAVDGKSNFIYLLTINPEPVIVKYTIESNL